MRTAGPGGLSLGKGDVSSVEGDGLPKGPGVAEAACEAGVRVKEWFLKSETGTSSGGPVVGIPRFQCRGRGFHP